METSGTGACCVVTVCDCVLLCVTVCVTVPRVRPPVFYRARACVCVPYV